MDIEFSGWIYDDRSLHSFPSRSDMVKEMKKIVTDAKISGDELQNEERNLISVRHFTC